VAYCAIEDLLLGDVPVSKSVDQQKYVNDAADEIDMLIGHRYVTPVDLSALQRPGKLLLKRVNVLLATGRLIIAVAAGAEGGRLNQYGSSLVKEALAWLEQIANGGILLEGATLTDSTNTTSGPSIKNKDTASGVDAFYENVMAPAPSVVLIIDEHDPVPHPGTGAYGEINTSTTWAPNE
jgi:phage gp36-like protein